MNEGFVIDRDRSVQVWNQPLAAYQTKVMGRTQPSRPGAPSGMVVSTKISYAKETTPAWESHEPYILSEQYTYSVDLDERGNVIGGDHQTWDRPDFAWKMQISDFHDYFSDLKTIYESSLSGQATYSSISERSIKRRDLAEDNVILSAESACFGTDAAGYKNNQYLSWSIVPEHEDRSRTLSISFKSFSTERYRDKVKVYEGARGEGPLLAVFHGQSVPEELLVKDSAYIVFSSDDAVTDAGFLACYTWV
jgi:hypothetical protein